MTGTVSRRRFTTGSAAALTGLALGGPALAGCASGQPGGTTEQGSGEPPTFRRYDGVKPDLAGTADGIPDGFFAYPEQPIKVFDAPPGDGKPVTAMAQSSEPIPPALGQNQYWQQLNDKLGSPLEMSVTPATDYSPKFATVVAGDDLPDIFQVAREANAVPQLLQSKALDLSEHLAGDAIADYPMLANIPSESWPHTMFNGSIYAIPIPRGVLQSTIMYRRDDLLDKIGIKVEPKNFTEFFEVCQELTAPQKNVWALSQAPTNFLLQMLKVPNVWRSDGGKLTSAYEVEEYAEGLDASRKMVEAGVVVPDSFAANANKYKEWFQAGTAYLTGDSYSAWASYYALAADRESFRLSALDMIGYDGGEGSIWVRSPTHSIVAINKKAKDRIKTILSILNWLAAPFGTEEYLFRKYGTKDLHYSLTGSDPTPIEGKVGETYLGLLYLADCPPVLYSPGIPEVPRTEHAHLSKVIPGGSPDPVEGLYSETMTRQGSTLSRKLGAVRDEIIQNRRPATDWAAAVAEWRSGGGDKIRAEYEEALQQRG